MTKLKEFLIFKICQFLEYSFIKINSLFKTKGVIVMFHHITDEELDVIPCCKCKIDRFTTIINELTHEYEFIHLKNINNTCIKNKFAIITFDDGCKDVFTNAYPILKKKNIPFTVYITQNFINKPGYMTEEDILCLNNDPLVTIGYHTRSHIKLKYCKNFKSECNVEKFSKFIRKDINYFAYPYGRIYEIGIKSIIFISKTKFKNAVGTINAPITRFSLLFRFYLPRIIIE